MSALLRSSLFGAGRIEEYLGGCATPTLSLRSEMKFMVLESFLMVGSVTWIGSSFNTRFLAMSSRWCRGLPLDGLTALGIASVVAFKLLSDTCQLFRQSILKHIIHK